MGEFMTKLSRTAGAAELQIKKHSPEIWFGVGVVSLIGAVVAAYKTPSKADEILEKHKKALKEADEAKEISEKEPEKYEYDDQLYLEDRRREHLKMAVGMARTFAPVICLTGLSIGSFLKAMHIINGRYLGAVAAYNAVSEAFQVYRDRVISERGALWDNHYMYGTELEEIDVTEVDENGKKHKHKEVVEAETSNVDKELATTTDTTCRFLDSSNDAIWDPNPAIMMQTLRGAQNYFNDRMESKGHLFLNEVYDYLGFPHTPEGALLGWIRDGGVGYVDLGFGDAHRDKFIRDFINGKINTLMLRFNHDGIIWDRI